MTARCAGSPHSSAITSDGCPDLALAQAVWHIKPGARHGGDGTLSPSISQATRAGGSFGSLGDGAMLPLQEYGVPFMETSAKTGMNVELAFLAIAK